MRDCPACGEAKPLDQFHSRKVKACIPCHAAAMKQYYHDNRARILARRKVIAEPLKKYRTEEREKAARALRVLKVRKCVKCGVSIAKDDFAKGGIDKKTAKNRKRRVCKSCWAASLRRYRGLDLDDFQARSRAYRNKNRDKLRSGQMRGMYGISLERYAEIFQSQDGVCASCGLPERTRHPISEQTKRLAIDHCHRTGRIRGLLCSRCNVALGLLNDDPERIKLLLAYLERARENHALR